MTYPLSPRGMMFSGLTQQIPTPAPDPVKPTLFGEGGIGRGIAGSIGDFLLQNAGAKPIYAPAMQDRRQWQQQLDAHNIQRQDALDQWIQQQIFKRNNPEPSDLQQRVDYLDKFKPGLGGTYAENYAANGGGAPQIVTTAQGTFAIPRSAYTAPTAAPAAGPTPGAIEGGYRFKGGNAADPTSWEPVGGAPSQGGATFR